MRRLMWFTLGFTAALEAGIRWQRELLPAALVGAVMVLLFDILGRKIRGVRVLTAISLGLTLGFLWFTGFRAGYLEPAARMDGKTVEARFTASDFGFPTRGGTGVDGWVFLRGKPYRVRIYLNREAEMAPGDQVEGKFQFRLTATGGKQKATYHSGRGIFLLAYEKEPAQIGRSEEKRDGPARIRKEIRETLDRQFPEDTAAFARALLLGDGSRLPSRTNVDLQVSGIRHLVAVSGLHVAILFGLVRALTLKKTWLTAILGTAVLGFFAAVAGFTPSVTRAAVMITLMMLAQALGRDYDPLTELSFACLLMMAVNPLVITAVSFQLSAASVLGILLFGERIRQWLEERFPVDRKKKRRKRLLGRLWSGLSVSLSALIFVTPLCARYFGTVSLVSVLTNFLTLWIVSYIFYGIILVCLLDLFWAWGAGALAWVTAWGIRYVLAAAHFCAGLPFAAVYTESPYIVFWLILVYGLLGIFLVQKKKQPGVLICCGTLGLCLALMVSWAEPLLPDAQMTVFDIGQGQCILLQSQGRSFLIDCGGDYGETAGNLAARTLLSQGAEQVDGLILTHYDHDHIGGVEAFLDRVEADRIFTPDIPTDKIVFDTHQALCPVGETTELSFGTSKITIFPGVSGGSPNENSLCVLFEGENCDILITGDRSEFGERMLLAEHDLPEVDCLIAGHHGAKNSTCRELLEAVRPHTVIISAGRDNSYGHPAPETLARLKEFGCRILRTDRDGTVIIRR